jgi:hypothetical protein
MKDWNTQLAVLLLSPKRLGTVHEYQLQRLGLSRSGNSFRRRIMSPFLMSLPASSKVIRSGT